MDKNSLAHTTWECKYHIVFAPKFRRRVIYGRIRADIGKILRELCERKGIEIIEAELCKDHVHMLIHIPPKYSVIFFKFPATSQLNGWHILFTNPVMHSIIGNAKILTYLFHRKPSVVHFVLNIH